MQILLALAIGLALLFSYNEYTEKQELLEETTAIMQQYDIDEDGQLSKDEQYSWIEDIYTENGGNEVTTKELSDAVEEAQDMLGVFDSDSNGDLSYEEQLSIVQAIYKKYDNGEIKNDMLVSILQGYERKVNELNSYYDLLEEVGVGGPKIYIDLRGDE